jgi:hypothetical protein
MYLLDLVGIVPNVIIISLCTTLVAISTLKKIAKAGADESSNHNQQQEGKEKQQ